MKRLGWQKEREKTGERRLYYEDMKLSETGRTYRNGHWKRTLAAGRSRARAPRTSAEGAVRVVRAPSGFTLTAQPLLMQAITKPVRVSGWFCY